MTTNNLDIDNANSKISFTVKKLGLLKIKGEITNLNGEIVLNNKDLKNSYFKVNVDPATINTSNQKRDEHLKNEDFFNVNKYPKIHFESSSIEEASGKYQVIGQLKILETTQQVTIPFTYKDKIFNGQFSLNRKEFGLGTKYPSLIVGNKIQIAINCKIK